MRVLSRRNKATHTHTHTHTHRTVWKQDDFVPQRNSLVDQARDLQISRDCAGRVSLSVQKAIRSETGPLSLLRLDSQGPLEPAGQIQIPETSRWGCLGPWRGRTWAGAFRDGWGSHLWA